MYLFTLLHDAHDNVNIFFFINIGSRVSWIIRIKLIKQSLTPVIPRQTNFLKQFKDGKKTHIYDITLWINRKLEITRGKNRERAKSIPNESDL